MKRTLAFLLITISLSSFVAKSQTTSRDITTRALIDSLERLMERDKIHGLMLTIIKNDSVVFSGGLGKKDLSADASVDEKTLFRLGSITKSFVALGVLKLVEEGKFSLDDEVKELLPDLVFDNGFEPEHPVRVKHLLSHTAGFDDMHLNEVYNITDTAEYPLAKVVKLNKSTFKVRWQPGTRYAYSNPGWSIAGYLIEKYSGVSYDEYVAKNILDPIGMAASNFKSVPEGAAYSRAYDGRGKEVPFLPIFHRPAGAFNSNASDMSKFLSFCLSRGRADSVQVVPAAVFDIMERPIYTLANQAGLPVGYGIGNYTFDSKLPIQFHGHDGGIDGFVSSYGYNSDHKIGFAISNNTGKGIGDLINLIKQYLVQEIPVSESISEALDSEAMTEFEGYYLFRASRNQLFAFIDRLFSTCEVTLEGDTLYLKYFMKDRFPVLPVKNSEGGGFLFRGVKDQTPSHIFLKNEKGVPVLATAGIGNYLEKVEYASVVTKRILFFGSIGLLLSACVAAIVWLIFAVKKTISWTDFFKRLVPTMAVLGLVMIVMGLTRTLNDLAASGMPNVDSVMVYLGTWIILFCALLSTRFGIMNFKTGQKMAFSVYYVFLAFSCVMMALFLYDAGWMGIKLWEY